VAVTTYDYPFAAYVQGPATGVEPPSPVGVALTIAPNPHVGDVRIRLAGLAAGAGTATLDVHDVSGRLVRHMSGDAAQGFVWDGHGENGAQLPAGIYLYRFVTPRGTWAGRSVMIR
jgi:hypothetical protein